MDDRQMQQNRATKAALASEATSKAKASARAGALITEAAENPQAKASPGKIRGKRSLNEDITYIDAPEDSSTAAHPMVHESFTATAYQDKLLNQVGIGSTARSRKSRPVASNEATGGGQVDGQTTASEQRLRSKLSKTLQRRLALKSALKPVELLTRARVTSINMGVLSWQFPLWLFVQLPFAVLSIICLGTAVAVDNLASENGGILAFLANKSLAVFDTIAKTIGIDFAAIAMDLFVLGMVLVLAVGMLSLLVMTLIYLMSGIHPLTGNGSSMKQGSFLLTILFYSIPFANMFPCVLLYMAAVWVHPK